MFDKLKRRIIGDTSQLSKNKEIHDIIKDKSVPLENRWEIYTLAVDNNYLVEEEPWYFIPNSLGDISLYDEYYIDKYETYDYSRFTDDFEGTEDELDNLKEDILENGCSSWKNDW